MANTYTLISNNILSSNKTSVNFTSIPNTYTDLCMKLSVRTDATLTYDFINFTFNNASANFSNTYLRGSGSAASSGNNSSQSFIRIYYSTDGDTATASTFGNAEIYIPSYTASQNKPLSAFGVTETNATAANMAITAGLWSDTSAITSILLQPINGSYFLTGSSFYLYGIKNS